MLIILGQFFVLGFTYGFIVKPMLDAKEERERINDFIASYEGSRSR